MDSGHGRRRGVRTGRTHGEIVGTTGPVDRQVAGPVVDRRGFDSRQAHRAQSAAADRRTVGQRDRDRRGVPGQRRRIRSRRVAPLHVDRCPGVSGSDRHRVIPVTGNQHQVVAGTAGGHVSPACHRHRAAGRHADRIVTVTAVERQVGIDIQCRARTEPVEGHRDAVGQDRPLVGCGSRRNRVGPRTADCQIRAGASQHRNGFEVRVVHCRRRCPGDGGGSRIDCHAVSGHRQCVAARAAVDTNLGRTGDVQGHAQAGHGRSHSVVDNRDRIVVVGADDVDDVAGHIDAVDARGIHTSDRRANIGQVHRNGRRGVRVIEHVTAVIAFDRVGTVTGRPVNRVRSVPTMNHVVIGPTGDVVVALTGINHVRPGAGSDNVVPGTPQDDVHTGTAGDRVVAKASDECRIRGTGTREINRVIAVAGVDGLGNSDRVADRDDVVSAAGLDIEPIDSAADRDGSVERNFGRRRRGDRVISLRPLDHQHVDTGGAAVDGQVATEVGVTDTRVPTHQGDTAVGRRGGLKLQRVVTGGAVDREISGRIDGQGLDAVQGDVSGRHA